MAKKRTRIAVPAEIERQIKVEAGFKCSMPRCDIRHCLHIHHIDEDPSNNDPANLVLLCQNCHALATSGVVDRKACRAIKQTLTMQASPKSELEAMKDEIIAHMEQLVGRQTEPQPLREEDKGTQPPNVEVDAAADQAIILRDADLQLPVGLVRQLALRSYESGDLEQALALQSLLTSTASANAIDHYNLGVLLSKLGRKGEAEQAYRKAIEADPEHAAAWSNLGNVLDDLGRKDEARQAYREAIGADPEFANAWSNLGVLLDELGRKDEAEQAYRKALKADPKLAAAWYNLGVLLDELGRRDEAEQAYRGAIEADPKHASAWTNLGVLLSELERKDEAEQAYRCGVAADNANSGLRNGLAYLLWELHRFDEAEVEIRRALEIEPNNCYANATLGLLLFEKGDVSGGRKQYEKAIRLGPDDLPLQQKFHFEYGRALAKNNQEAEARREFKKAAQISSTYVPLCDIEAELEKLNRPK